MGSSTWSWTVEAGRDCDTRHARPRRASGRALQERRQSTEESESGALASSMREQHARARFSSRVSAEPRRVCVELQ